VSEVVKWSRNDADVGVFEWYDGLSIAPAVVVVLRLSAASGCFRGLKSVTPEVRASGFGCLFWTSQSVAIYLNHIEQLHHDSPAAL
jgi:hypothetical protein